MEPSGQRLYHALRQYDHDVRLYGQDVVEVFETESYLHRQARRLLRLLHARGRTCAVAHALTWVRATTPHGLCREP